MVTAGSDELRATRDVLSCRDRAVLEHFQPASDVGIGVKRFDDIFLVEGLLLGHRGLLGSKVFDQCVPSNVC